MHFVFLNTSRYSFKNLSCPAKNPPQNLGISDHVRTLLENTVIYGFFNENYYIIQQRKMQHYEILLSGQLRS